MRKSANYTTSDNTKNSLNKNIEVDKNGNCHMIMYDHMIKLRGRTCNIIGRSVIIHADEDNLGIPGDKESLTTGKAGKRLDCAVIGYDDRIYFN